MTPDASPSHLVRRCTRLDRASPPKRRRKGRRRRRDPGNQPARNGERQRRPASPRIARHRRGRFQRGHSNHSGSARLRASRDKVFYATPNPVAEIWLRRVNPSSSTLQDCYAEGKPREKTYQEMSGRILAAVRDGLHVCAVFYGHPGVLVQPAHAAIRGMARRISGAHAARHLKRGLPVCRPRHRSR